MTLGVLFKVIVFSLLIYWIGKFIFRIVVPVYLVKKRFDQQFQQFQEQTKAQEGFSTDNGKTRVYNTDTQPSDKTKAVPFEGGEYIDYEEVK